jgi:hypothetical protein
MHSEHDVPSNEQPMTHSISFIIMVGECVPCCHYFCNNVLLLAMPRIQVEQPSISISIL